MVNSGALSKMFIKAYSDEEFKDEVPEGTYTALLNPESYSFNYTTVQNEDQAPGTSSTAPKFAKSLPQELTFEFLFDRTGALLDSPLLENGIIDDIEHFKKVVFDYQGEQHRPNYLKIAWGSLLFKGVLNSLDINFKLFKADGTPIRAIASIKLIGFVEDNLRVAIENNQSPDLTHYREVKNGDTLPLMAYRIYGDSKYYLEVARANRIYDFRTLKIGMKIYFPPLEKMAK
ncbi:LysM peptidoglycan-binding domain-containing protein [Belliella kenyensis]|uniref:LysM peptidoglycan-binding domain-containing protein n=1 Tax=Belliella kenyensis TaxID=1472724 RepID=A0ABV8EJS0_9BACT|nr:LysM peptidoglycan-binding domain-containing protein [Belliella kenyensis]MCH7400370.1 LysM peptidoglycan-binding domain-containing protein [Belliella kenyensis]MDN3604612.1 LysM peptidoglycan-binding domain-containing protein [Belliella kenyensis]